MKPYTSKISFGALVISEQKRIGVLPLFFVPKLTSVRDWAVPWPTASRSRTYHKPLENRHHTVPHLSVLNKGCQIYKPQKLHILAGSLLRALEVPVCRFWQSEVSGFAKRNENREDRTAQFVAISQLFRTKRSRTQMDSQITILLITSILSPFTFLHVSSFWYLMTENVFCRDFGALKSNPILRLKRGTEYSVFWFLECMWEQRHVYSLITGRLPFLALQLPRVRLCNLEFQIKKLQNDISLPHCINTSGEHDIQSGSYQYLPSHYQSIPILHTNRYRTSTW